MKTLLFIGILQMMWTVVCLAEVRVSSTVNPQAVSPDDLLTLTVRIEYQGSAQVQSPQLPDLKDFYMVNQSVSESYQFGSGGSKSQKEYQYSLKPKKEGQFQIEPVKIIVDGNEYQTNSVKVEVSSQIPPQPSPPAQRGRIWGSFLDPFFGGGSPFFPSGDSVKEEDILFKLILDRKEPYVGEMIVAEWFFYLKREQTGYIFNTTIERHPNLSGFWMETLEQPVSVIFVNPTREEIGGIYYLRDLLTSMAIFPLRAGSLNIGALKATLSTRSLLSIQSVFEKATQQRKMTVLPLPQQGIDDFFTGAVGDFQISASVNKNTGSVQDPIIYKVGFEGRGHPRLIQLPKLSFGSSWEVYDITESQNFNFSKSTKEFEVILIPKKSGTLKIPSFELSTFDPQLGIYKTHILPGFSLEIKKGKVQEGSVTGDDKNTEETKNKNLQPEEISVTGEENNNITDLWLSGEIKRHWASAYRWQIWFIAYGALFLLSMLLIFRAVLFHKKLSPLEKVIKERLKLIDQKIKHQLSREAGSQLTQLIYFFLSELGHRELRPLSQNLESLLKSVPPSLKNRYEAQVKKVIVELEEISFAPEETAQQLRTQNHLMSLRNKTFTLLKSMEKYYYRTSPGR